MNRLVYTKGGVWYIPYGNYATVLAPVWNWHTRVCKFHTGVCQYLTESMTVATGSYQDSLNVFFLVYKCTTSIFNYFCKKDGRKSFNY
ncbi:MAG: hypothetical protein LBV64_01135 [Mediterranea sp.]|nr:hypothetical protein [Mediterranea sp.]